MVVIIGESFPDKIRGVLKRWFLEPKPNVFVGHVNEKVRSKLLDYIRRNCEGLRYTLIFTDSRNCQHFCIENHDAENYHKVPISGLDLIGRYSI